MACEWVFDCLRDSLKPQVKATMEEPISIAEIYKALKGMPKGKTPRPDGIPTEFYLQFGHDLVIPLLEEIYNHAATFGELPTDFLNGDIVIIPKAGDPTSCHNKRPITLLNSAYKIFSTIWQKRLAIAADFLVTWNQTTFMRGRSIHRTVLLCNEVLHYHC